MKSRWGVDGAPVSEESEEVRRRKLVKNCSSSSLVVGRQAGRSSRDVHDGDVDSPEVFTRPLPALPLVDGLLYACVLPELFVAMRASARRSGW